MFTQVLAAERRFGLPDYVKTAELQEPEQRRAELDNLPDSSFADPHRRKFPIHTKTAAYLSNAEFWDNALFSEDDDHTANVGRKLLSAAKYFGIEADVKRIAEKVAAEHTKYTSELSDECYALTFDWHGSKQRFFPIISADLTKQAAADFYANRLKFPFAMRKQAATRILEKAASYNVSLMDVEGYEYLEAASGKHPSTTGSVSDAFNLRSTLLLGREYGEISTNLEKTAADIRRCQELPADLAEKSAAILDQIDQETGLYERYSRGGLPLPEETIYPRVEKRASVTKRAAKLQSGDVITLDMVKAAGVSPFHVLTDYQDAVMSNGEFDPELAIDVLPSMPRDDARVYVEAMMATKSAAIASLPVSPLLKGKVTAAPTVSGSTPKAVKGTTIAGKTEST